MCVYVYFIYIYTVILMDTYTNIIIIIFVCRKGNFSTETKVTNLKVVEMGWKSH